MFGTKWCDCSNVCKRTAPRRAALTRMRLLDEYRSTADTPTAAHSAPMAAELKTRCRRLREARSAARQDCWQARAQCASLRTSHRLRRHQRLACAQTSDARCCSRLRSATPPAAPPLYWMRSLLNCAETLALPSGARSRSPRQSP
jgi:hypothetical protein